MSLNTIYKKVTRECYIDDRGVYTADGERVALSNDGNECYIRYDGTSTTERIGASDYLVTTPYVLVGSGLCVSPGELARATVSALATCRANITEITTSKQEIADSEGIDLSKFVDIALVRVSYDVEEHKAYDYGCIYTDAGTNPDSGCGNANVLLNGSNQWEVLCEGALDIRLKNEQGETITPVSVSGNVVTIDDTGGECQDAAWTLKDTAGGTLNSGTIASGASADITAPNATANLRNTDGTAISTIAIKSGETRNVTAPNAEAVLKDSAGTVITTEQIPSNTSEDITAPDAVATLNGAAFLSLKSNSTTDIELVDQDDNPITPDSVAGAKITVTVGCDVDDPKALTNFTTLAWTNPFGNTNRFTDTLGGSAYANDLVIDWTTYNPCEGTVLIIYRAPYGPETYANALAYYAGLTIGAWSGFEIMQMCTAAAICHPTLIAGIGSTQTVLNYSPFNYGITASASTSIRCIYFDTGGATQYRLDYRNYFILGADSAGYTHFGEKRIPLTSLGL